MLKTISLSFIDYIAPAGRQSPKPMKFKKITKMKDKQIASCACGTQLSAIIDKEGKMYLFGQVEDDLVDKQTGKYPLTP